MILSAGIGLFISMHVGVSMKKIAIFIFLFALCVLLFSGTPSATGHGHEQMLTEAKRIIDANVSCDKLTDDQFEALGEYYMEQMHPGEAHERMDRMMSRMMGEEGLRQMHINMGIRMYCGGMGGGMGGGMMGSRQYPSPTAPTGR
jgi:hypothetical protein